MVFAVIKATRNCYGNAGLCTETPQSNGWRTTVKLKHFYLCKLFKKKKLNCTNIKKYFRYRLHNKFIQSLCF